MGLGKEMYKTAATRHKTNRLGSKFLKKTHAPKNTTKPIKTSLSNIRIKNMKQAGKERKEMSRGKIREHFEKRVKKSEQRKEKIKGIAKKHIKKEGSTEIYS